MILIKELGMMFPTKTSKKKSRYGMYRCKCGKEIKTVMSSVKNGDTKSCGCSQKERLTVHGLASHRLYKTWSEMMNRCTNKKDDRYKYYGERDIKVCDRWMNVKNFIDDMYPTFIEGLTIDREDNTKGYSKDNCRWATKSVQSRNTRILNVNNKSGYRGVAKRNNRKFTSQIVVNSKYIYIGSYIDPRDAAKAYDNYVIENNLEHTINGV